MAGPLYRPDVSNLEQRVDPIVRADQTAYEREVQRAQADIGSHVRFSEFDQDVQNKLAERVARLRLNAKKEKSVQRLEQQSDRFGQNPTRSPLPRLILRNSQAGSVLDATGLSALRDADSVGDVLPVVGSMLGSTLLRRVAPPAAVQFTQNAINRTRQALLATERGRELTGGALGAATGAMMEQRLEEASAAVRAGLEPVVLKDFPTVGFLITGPVDTNGNPTGFQDGFTKLANAASREALLDAAGFGVTDIGGRVLRRGFAAFVGDERLAMQALSDAEKVGVPVGLVDIIDPEKAPLAASVRRMFAAFGPLGTPFRRADLALRENVQGAAVRQVARISPEIGVLAQMASRGEDVNRLSRVMSERGISRFNLVTRRYTAARDQMFSEVYSQANDIPVVPATLRSQAAQLSARFNVASGQVVRFIKKEALEDVEGLTKEELDLLAKDAYESVDVDTALTGLKELARDIGRMESEPSVAALLNFSKEIESALTSTDSRFAAAQYMQLRRAIDEDIMRTLEVESPELAAKLEAANAYVEGWINLVGGAAGRRVRGVAKDFGSQTVQRLPIEGGRIVKNPGTRDLSVLLEHLSEANSPGEVSQLYKMLSEGGPDGLNLFRQVAATRLQRSVTTAIAGGRFSVRRAFEAIGLFDSASTRGKVTSEFIRRAGGDIKSIRTLADVARKALPDNLNLNSVATATRRAVLGGLASGVSGVLGVAGLTRFAGAGSGTSVAAGAASAITIFVLARYMGEVLTNPQLTRQLIELASTDSPLKRGAIVKSFLASGLLGAEQFREHKSGNQGVLSPGTIIDSSILAAPPTQPGVR